jgi:hypothetical protein
MYLGRRMNLLARLIANVPNVFMRRCVKAISWLKEKVKHRKDNPIIQFKRIFCY